MTSAVLAFNVASAGAAFDAGGATLASPISANDGDETALAPGAMGVDGHGGALGVLSVDGGRDGLAEGVDVWAWLTDAATKVVIPNNALSQ
jgi:hypothetical protein